ncbi:hemerythrin family protein [Helicobacter sp. MIT 21-1697]|uniref:hemerythrin family protein n=1 Tax=Helicobacter sp. MIT 21-1697 TaxID=2993733 RepID=UPI00224B7709|nr:hemerythrin family protein [Helicobacter sp. MIT 21-1697]MCX2716571.1 hemerythrin family protein [Helicobacter sp. MIT 21-1697]
MLPEWSDDFSVHHQIIDEQHQKLFTLAHRAYSIANNNKSSANDVKSILLEFFDYMKTHFKDEEQYMQAIGFPQLDEHKKIHRQIVNDMAGMVKNVHSVDVLKEMIATIAKDWLLTHILQEDMCYEKYREEQQNVTCEVKYCYYTCGCPGKEHKLTESMHLFIKNSSHPTNCQECHQPIKFKDQH